MSIDNSNSPKHAADDGLPPVKQDEDDDRQQDGGVAADLAGEVLVNGAQLVIDGVGHVVSSVISSLGDIG